MEADLRKLNGAQQIVVLKTLRQNAAAYLLGLSPRSVRNHPEIPRGADGRYDAKSLLSYRSTASQRDPNEIAEDLMRQQDLRSASAS